MILILEIPNWWSAVNDRRVVVLFALRKSLEVFHKLTSKQGTVAKAGMHLLPTPVNDSTSAI